MYLTSYLAKGSSYDDQYASIYRKTYVTPIDRFGFHSLPGDLILHPESLYTPNRCLKDYGTVCDERAEELLGMGKMLYVYWSGGIDSTVLLTALMRAGATERNLTVVCNRQSLMENKPFYDEFIEGQFTTKESVPLPQMLTDDTSDYLIVTGEHNDQLFGADLMIPVFVSSGIDALKLPFSRLSCHMAAGGAGWNFEMAEALFSLVDESSKHVGVKIKLMSDAYWWLNFCFKWQNVNLRTLMLTGSAPKETVGVGQFRRIIHFFATDAFQDWSVTGHEKKIHDSWRTYKLPAKRYIYRHTRNEAFLKHAVKIGSLGKLIKGSDPVYLSSPGLKLHERPAA